MKEIKKFLTITIGLLIISCSSNDSNEQESESSGLLKRMEIQSTSTPYIYEFNYNDNNTINEIYFYNYFAANRKDNFYYNSQGNVEYVESVLLNNDQVVQTVNFNYNGSNELISEIKIDNQNNNEIIERRDYFYENGVLNCLNRCYDSECNSFLEICYEYDGNGNPITTTYRDDNGQSLAQIDISEFDNGKSAFFGSNLTEINYSTNPALGFLKTNNNLTSRDVTTYNPSGDILFEFQLIYLLEFNSSDLPIKSTVNSNQLTGSNNIIFYEYY